jgi:nucleotide-binding universal stress UspA family protein
MLISDVPRRILWSVDPFEEPGELQANALRVLELVGGRTGAEIEPVYVMSPAELNLPLNSTQPWIEQYRPVAEKALRSVSERLRAGRVAPPKVLVESFSSTAQAVRTLARFAEQTGADLIALNTHGRTGMSRLFLGSFAESLLHRSKVPVLVIGPKMKATRSFDRILFPTELAHRSQAVFRRVASLARSFGSRLVLFHAIPRPIEPVFQSGIYLLGGSWMPVHAYFSEAEDRQRKHAERWAAWARAQGVETEVVIESKAQNVVDSLSAIATEKGATLIAMESRSGRLSSALIGSLTRQVLRNACCPVWVFPACARRQARKEPDEGVQGRAA